MADATPIAANHLQPAPRPPTPIWSRRWAGFPAAPPPPIGRARDVARLCAMLQEPRRRLVTVTGPGGVGKTRLALAAAEEVAVRFADGAAFVALADIRDPALLLPTVARVLEVRQTPGRFLPDALFAILRECHLLLVLDNFEHLAGTAADVSALLAACPQLTVLVTSRVPLHLHDERLFATPPLAVPAASAVPDPATLAEYGAVTLFVERARLVEHAFTLTTANAPAVAEICRRLDGIPLAIELAAAWVRAIPPAALLGRLQPQLPMLRGGARDQPLRFRTMRDAIAWSYDLLRDDEQRFFRSLGVFVGGFTLEAAEWVGGRESEVGGTIERPTSDPRPPTPDSRPPPSDSALDLLAALVDKSLAYQTDPDGAQPRFALLETVREFALERLADHGGEGVADAHAAHFLALAESAADNARDAERAGWMRRLVLERANMRAALDQLDQTGQTTAVLQMTGALWPYWYRLGDLAEGRTRLERALAAAPRDVAPDLRARALRGVGVLAWQSGDYDRSREWLETALAAYDATGDRAGAAWSHNSLGCLAATRGETERAERSLTASLAIFREVGDTSGIAQLTANLGELAEAEGAHDLAIERLDAALAMWRDPGDRVGAARAQVFLGQALLAQGQAARAETVLQEALATIRDIEYEQILPAALRTVAHLAARRGDTTAAARWCGAEEALRQKLGLALPAARLAAHATTVAGVCEALGEAAFAAAWAAGRLLSPDQVVAEVLANAGTAPALTSVPASPALAGPGTLSQRERQVLALLIEGRSDREIAAALFIGQRTASTHVSAILHKLDVGTRAEAAVRAVRAGLV